MSKRLWGVVVSSLFAVGCFPALTGAPCSSDDNCPSGQVCSADGVCVRPDGTGGGSGGGSGGGGGDDGGPGGGTGGGSGGGTGGGGGDDGGADGGGGDGGTGGGGGDDGGTGDAGVAQLVVDRSRVDFGSVTVNATSASQTVTVTNTGGVSSGPLMVGLSGAQAGRFTLESTTCTGALAPMSSCQVVLTFSPNATGPVMASLDVSGMPGGAVTSVLSGQGAALAALSIAPAMFDFGALVLGTSSPGQVFTITNTGGSPSGIPSVSVIGTEFNITLNNCTMVLPANGTCTVTVVFTPTSSGSKAATLQASASPGGMASAAISGSAQTPAALSGMPSPGVFGLAANGTNGMSITFTITNTGEATTPSLTTTVAGTNGGDFFKTADMCNGATLMGGSACTVTLQFRPTAVGSRSGTLTVTGTGIIPAVIPLGGVGQTPAQLQFSSNMLSLGVATVGGAPATAVMGISNLGDVPSGMPTFTTMPANEFSVLTNTCGATIGAGASCSVTVQFSPAAVGARSGTLQASATPGGTVNATLSGTGVTAGSLTISPATRNYGSQVIGLDGGQQLFTVTNTGGSSVSNVNVVVVGTDQSSFIKSNDTCNGGTLPAGNSCTANVTFLPQARGALSAFVQASSGGTGTVQSSVSGTGLTPATLSIAPTSRNYPTQVVGDSVSDDFVVTNDGDVASGVPMVSVTGAAFSIKTNGCTGALPPLGTCVVSVTFLPPTAANHSGSLLVSAAPGGSATASLSGSAITPANLTLAPAGGSSTNFGNVLQGATADRTFTVTNTGQQTAGPLALNLTGMHASMFQIIGGGPGACTVSQLLATGQSCQVLVRFSAGSSAPGGKTASLVATATPGGAPTLTLQANVQAPAQLVSMQTANDFMGQEVGTTSPSFVWTVSNAGDVPTGTLTTSNSDPTNFIVAADSCNGVSLMPMQSCLLRVAFAPATHGIKTAQLRVSGTPGGAVYLDVRGQGQWRLTLTRSGPGTGTLSTEDGRIMNCTAPPCSALYDNGISVKVLARTANNTNSHFMNWTSPASCAAIGNGRDCGYFAMTSSVTANVTFGSNANYNLAFTSSTTEPANLGGVAPYDARCNALATAAGINNLAGDDYVAWMSSSTSSVLLRLTTSGGFRRMDGSVFAVSRAALVSSSGGVVVTQLDLDETGKRIPAATASTWTGTSKLGSHRAGHSCNDWTQTLQPDGGQIFLDRGRTAGGPGLWTEGTASHTCSNTGTRIYCLQKSRTNVLSLPAPPAGARFVYLAPPSTFTGGRAAMDSYCNSNKPNSPPAAASATYVALVATTTESAGSRIVAGTYYRPDGTLVGTDTQIKAGALEAGIWQGSGGGYVNPTNAYDPNILAWTGGAGLNAVATTFNCSNWTSNLSTVTSLVGRATSAAGDFFDGNGTGNSCATPRPVYCIQATP
ncbi:MAG: choice-of-anchor D domain-containing protein [Myxococcota bacterium]